MILKIDQEFKNLIPPLTHEERSLLEKNIVKEGCRDPIVIWDNIIIDGHNRYDICTLHDLEFKTAEVELSNRNEAVNWIIDNQLGKRNVPEQIKKYLNGMRKHEHIQPIGGDRKSQQFKEKSEVQNEPLIGIKTVPKLAEKLKISESTVKRSGDFAEAINKIAESSGKTAMEILTTTKVTQEDAKKIATLEPEVQKEIVDKVTTGETKTFKEALKPIIELEQKQTLEEKQDTDYCAYTPFTPLQSQITTCPCGCGYGYCETNETWYNPDQIKELKEE
jgi:phosphopantetheine adenylyltransferase